MSAPGPASRTTGPAATAPNRGPAAAAGNRAALLASARRLFAAQGYAVPLSAVAKDAGVGQGTLYRHFPTREALAAGVVEDTMARLVARAATTSGPGAFGTLWQQVVETLVDSVGFLDVVLGPRGELHGRLPAAELADLLAGPLEQARAAGLVDADLTLADVMLTLAMVHGAAHRVDGAAGRRDAAYRALALVGRGLQLG